MHGKLSFRSEGFTTLLTYEESLKPGRHNIPQRLPDYAPLYPYQSPVCVTSICNPDAFPLQLPDASNFGEIQVGFVERETVKHGGRSSSEVTQGFRAGLRRYPREGPAFWTLGGSFE